MALFPGNEADAGCLDLIKEPFDVTRGIEAAKQHQYDRAAQKNHGLMGDSSPALAEAKGAGDDAKHQPTRKREQCKVERWHDHAELVKGE